MVVVLVLVFILSATVTVFLLIRTGDTRVPKELLDKSETEAQQIAQKAGLRVNVVRLADDHPANTVFRTDPPPGASVKKDSLVRVYVSTGPAPGKAQVDPNTGEVLVPDLAGKPLAEAQQVMQQSGLKTIVQRRSHPTVPANAVIETNPASQAPVKKDSTIALIVSSGPRPKNENGNANISSSANTNRPATTTRPANLNRQ
jgi:serine/threonine-protein kinase